MFDLAKNFRTVTMQGMLECAGSGRSAYKPSASGTPWLETGGMGCPSWGGVRLADLLKAAGVKPNAVHVAGQGGDPGHGADRGAGDPLDPDEEGDGRAARWSPGR